MLYRGGSNAHHGKLNNKTKDKPAEPIHEPVEPIHKLLRAIARHGASPPPDTCPSGSNLRRLGANAEVVAPPWGAPRHRWSSCRGGGEETLLRGRWIEPRGHQIQPSRYHRS